MVTVTRRMALLGGAASICCLASVAKAASPKLTYGCVRSSRGPVQADFYVSPEGQDDWEGSLNRPVRTIGRGVALLKTLRSGSLAIRGGIYRERVDLQGLSAPEGERFTIHNYGDEKVIVSAMEELTEWRSLSPEEVRKLGAPDGVVVAEARIHLAGTEHRNNFGLNLCSGNERAGLAFKAKGRPGVHSARQVEAFEIGNKKVDENGHLVSIQSSAFLGMSENETIERRLVLHAVPNIVVVAKGFSTDTGNGFVTIDSGGEEIKPQAVRQDDRKTRYLIENDPAQLRPGSHIVSRPVRGEVRVFYAPKTGDVEAESVSYSARSRCFTLRGCRNVRLLGLDFVGASAGGTTDTRKGSCLLLEGGCENVDVVNCSIRANFDSDRRGTAAFINGCKGILFSNCSIEDACHSFGVTFRNSSDVKFTAGSFLRVSNSPLRVFGVKNMEFSFSKMQDSAYDVHANKFNYYLGCDSVLNYGIVSKNTGGYAVFHNSSRIHFAFCRLDAASKSYDRAIIANSAPPADEGGNEDHSGTPGAGSEYYYWNNTLYARPGETSKYNSAMTIGPKGTADKHILVNNILFGLSSNGLDVQRTYNIYKGLHWTQVASKGWVPAKNEEVALGSRRHRLTQGADFSPVIQARLAQQFPHFKRWNVDADGRKFDWAVNPPIGCSIEPADSQPWLDRG